MDVVRCYMCTVAATSDEHVPPRCLFPEGKDILGDYRKNLITVPSCVEHNSGKSKDDEFLMVSLAGIIGNNSIGYQHRFTKVDRALKRSAYRLLEKVVIKQTAAFKAKVGHNKFVDVIWGTPDIERLRLCFHHVAMGLHYSHFGHRFEGEVKLLFGYFSHEPGEARTFTEMIQTKTDVELRGRPRVGDNPDVFYYQVTDFDVHGLFLIKMVFYGGLDVYAAFTHKFADPPNNLVKMLMDAGVPTIFEADGKLFEFNSPSLPGHGDEAK